MDDLQQHVRERALVSISREGVDSHSIQCFVLAASAELVLLQYIYDFQIDGLMVLRRADLSEMRRSDTDVFQQRLMAEYGLLKSVAFDLQIDITNWRSVIQQLAGQYPLMILESELAEEPDFLIGRVVDVSGTGVNMHAFSGTARWFDGIDFMAFDEITSCQVDTPYINAYLSHPG